MSVYSAGPVGTAGPAAAGGAALGASFDLPHAAMLTATSAMIHFMASSPFIGGARRAGSLKQRAGLGANLPRLRLGFGGTRIVARLHVREEERSFAADLEDRLTASRGIVMRVRRCRNETAGRQRLRLAHVDGVAHPDQERARQHGDVLVRRMKMRRELVTLRQMQPNRIDAGFAGVALHHREAGARGQA